MKTRLALSSFVLSLAATIAAAQPAPPGRYDPNVEASYAGVVSSMISVASPDGTVGVHLDLKTATGTIVKIQLGPAAYVSHDGDVAIWARQISKAGKTLELREPDGTPRWTQATADDPDGCGVSHAPVRY